MLEMKIIYDINVGKGMFITFHVAVGPILSTGRFYTSGLRHLLFCRMLFFIDDKNRETFEITVVGRS